jgi:RNA polymerase sigma-70 factor (ECF subfamily)
MQDDAIVSLYWERDEAAISETAKKYGKYLSKIAYNVLSDLEDTEECVNDTYMKAWNSMPPNRPGVLSTFLGKITRQAAIDIFRKKNSEKRRSSQFALSLSELEECVSAGDVTEQNVEIKELSASISNFLRTLSPEASGVFIGRYYFMDSIQDIAANFGMSQPKVKSMLHRTRIALKNHLEQEGYNV